MRENILTDKKGFTMIEVLMAMVIFLIGFLAVGSMQIAAVNGNAAARTRTEAMTLASDVVEQLMALPYNSSGFIGPFNISNPLDDTDPTVGQPTVYGWYSNSGDLYDVRWSVDENLPVTNTKTVEVTVRWRKKGQTKQVNLSFLTADANLGWD